MRTVISTLLALLLGQLLGAQHIAKITGPLGLYHSEDGYSYNDSTGADSTIMEYEFRFGELDIPCQLYDNNFYFQPDVDSCVEWNINRVMAIVQPPSEHGVYNQPADTSLYTPFVQDSGPGMIQAGQRFSRLSQLYGGFCGVVLDDWNGDTAITHQIRDAVRGKQVNADGTVESGSVATTPYNKLYCVYYKTTANPGAMPVIDGLSYWNFQNQNCCYTSFDSDITQLRANFPGKEIMPGIYLRNSSLGWVDPASVQYMLAHSFDRYDDGDINGITLFAGLYLMKYDMPLSIWNEFALPHWLDSLYYPCLGEGQGTVYDCSGNVVEGAYVHVFCEGRVSGDTMMRSSQKSDISGQYHFGLWAGNRSTTSTHYWLIAEKPGYIGDTVGFWINRQDTTNIPNAHLCPASDTLNSTANLRLVPNPTSGICTITADAKGPGDLEIYDMLGKKLYSTTQTHSWTQLDLSAWQNGVYLVIILGSERKVTQKQLLVLQH
jgi:hypothetical protein